MGKIKKFSEFLNEDNNYATKVKKMALSLKTKPSNTVDQLVRTAQQKITQLEKQQDNTGDNKDKWNALQAQIEQQRIIIEAAGRVKTDKMVPKKNS